MSMSSVIRDSIKYSVDQKGIWNASKPRPFDADKTKEEPIYLGDWIETVEDIENIPTMGIKEGQEDE